jgi:hypothetical protein
VRRNFSIGCLLFAWLCANGALWNVVQVVGWVKMLHDYSETMPATKAFEITFDGSAPCKLCHLSQTAEDTARQQLPHEANLGDGVQKIILASESVPAVVMTAPENSWPGIEHDAGLIRTEAVPVRPPRV